MRLFVSYKVEDSNLVRGVAERLLGQGVDLWFAEYHVLPENYGEFQRAIDDGIGGATHALVFSNRRWAESKWCRYEMEGLLRGMGGAENVIEVCIPKDERAHREFPGLAEGSPIVFAGNHRNPSDEEIDGLVRTLGARLPIPDAARSAPVLPGQIMSFGRYGVQVDTGPLRPAPGHSFLAQLAGTQFLRSATFKGGIDGIEVSLDVLVQPFRSVLGDISIERDRAADDRRVFTAYREYAGRWLAEEGARRSTEVRARGLHLFFIGERSHLGLTYTSKRISDQECFWERRYAIKLGEDKSDPGEASLVFAARLRGRDGEQFQQLCRIAPKLDHIARSFKQVQLTTSERVLGVLPHLLARSVYAGVAVGALVHFMGRERYPVAVVALAVAAGYLLADLALLSSKPLYRRLLLSLYPLGDELGRRSAAERLSSDLFDAFTVVPLDTVTAPLIGIRNLLKKPMRLLAFAGLGGVTYAAWLWLCHTGELSTMAVLVPAGALWGSILKVVGIRDWLRAKRHSAPGVSST
jgi:hypothetical protein